MDDYQRLQEILRQAGRTEIYIETAEDAKNGILTETKTTIEVTMSGLVRTKHRTVKTGVDGMPILNRAFHGKCYCGNIALKKNIRYCAFHNCSKPLALCCQIYLPGDVNKEVAFCPQCYLKKRWGVIFGTIIWAFKVKK